MSPSIIVFQQYRENYQLISQKARIRRTLCNSYDSMKEITGGVPFEINGLSKKIEPRF